MMRNRFLTFDEYNQFRLCDTRLCRNLTKLLHVKNVVENNCGNLPSTVLVNVLGAAFNSRYMSIEPPANFDEDYEDHPHLNKRSSEFDQSFVVEDTYAVDISEKPAWELRHGTNERDGHVLTN
ncbi:Protein trunk, partial [Pseudolycoriella hygida]